MGVGLVERHLLPAQAHEEWLRLLLSDVVKVSLWNSNLGSAYVVSQYLLNDPGSSRGLVLESAACPAAEGALTWHQRTYTHSPSLPLFRGVILSRSLLSSNCQFSLLYNGCICQSTTINSKIHSNLLKQKEFIGKYEQLLKLLEETNDPGSMLFPGTASSPQNHLTSGVSFSSSIAVSCLISLPIFNPMTNPSRMRVQVIKLKLHQKLQLREYVGTVIFSCSASVGQESTPEEVGTGGAHNPCNLLQGTALMSSQRCYKDQCL